MSAELDADLIVIGGGHNGLVCAAYAARAGYRVLLCERREDIGGAVCTRTMFGGYRMDVGGSLHTLIRATPIIGDLELSRYGLEYLEVDPIFSAPFADGQVFHLYRDLEKTCQSIASFSEQDAEAYYRFVKEWQPITEAIFRLFCRTPTLNNLGRYLLLPHHGFRRGRRIEMLRLLMQSYGTIIRNTFHDPRLQAVLAWWGAQSGPPPEAQASAPLFTWQSMLHHIGAGRPRGGSGMLSEALARYIEAHNGRVLRGVEAHKVIVAQGRAVGIECIDDRRYFAAAVVCNAHIWHLFNRMIESSHLSPAFLRRINQLPVGNGFGMAVRCSIDSLPNYPLSEEENRLTHRGLQLICPSMQYLTDAYSDYLRGEPSRRPAALAMTFSALDKSLAPPGKHTLFVWGQYYPYNLRGNKRWSSIAQREGKKLLKVVDQLAPGTFEAINDCYIQSPDRIASLHAMPNANVMHLDMSIDSMLLFRPLPELSRYATPIRGLYLANAGMHPGGGIFGAAGYNCSIQVCRWLSRRGQ